jgi:RNA polymerase sigma-32 factor
MRLAADHVHCALVWVFVSQAGLAPRDTKVSTTPLSNNRVLALVAFWLRGRIGQCIQGEGIMRGSQGTQRQLTRYLDEIRRFPLLEAQEENRLANAWRVDGDRKALDRLVTSHLRLVVKIASSFQGYGLPISEIVSEGNIGLIQAVERFEPDRNCRLATYAVWWIKAAIHEYILRSWSLVRIGTTAGQKKLFFGLRRAKNSISAFEQGDLHPDHVSLIAERLGVAERDVIEMNRRLGGDFSLNSPRSEDGLPSPGTPRSTDRSGQARAQHLRSPPPYG